jgi:hypothetical protein
LISKRVGKAEYLASRHFHTPGIAETETGSRRALSWNAKR